MFQNGLNCSRRLLQQLIQSQNSSKYLNATQNRLFSTSRIYGSNKKQKDDSELDLTFSDHKNAFRSKTTWEVFRGYLVFRLCAVTYLVDNHQRFMNITKKVFGKTIFEKLMKLTFYGHFVVDEEEIVDKIIRMESYGVKPIIDYSVEEDVVEDKNKSNLREGVPPENLVKPVNKILGRELNQFHRKNLKDGNEAVKTGTHVDIEDPYDKNAVVFLRSILRIGSEKEKYKDDIRFTAIKLTALVSPELLMHLSEAITRVHQYMTQFSGRIGAKNVIEHQLTEEDIVKELDAVAKENPTVNAWLDNLITDSSGVIHIIPWESLIKGEILIQDALKVPNPKTGKMENLAQPLTAAEEQMFRRMFKRIHTILFLARKLNVRVMIDAEQTYFQLAISRITMEFMKMYNKEIPIVFNTYQCYLQEAQHSLLADLIQSDRQNFHFGAKLVRGAYMDQERERAIKMGYPVPINKDFEATSRMYQICMMECLKRIKAEKEIGRGRNITIMAATHNEETVRFIIENMRKLGLDKTDTIFFGQLYGMCDQISFPLAQAGYSAYKYIPYGPVSEVLPYLGRRLIENRGMLDKTVKERRLLRKELFRRMFHRS